MRYYREIAQQSKRTYYTLWLLKKTKPDVILKLSSWVLGQISLDCFGNWHPTLSHEDLLDLKKELIAANPENSKIIIWGES